MRGGAPWGLPPGRRPFCCPVCVGCLPAWYPVQSLLSPLHPSRPQRILLEGQHGNRGACDMDGPGELSFGIGAERCPS